MIKKILLALAVVFLGLFFLQVNFTKDNKGLFMKRHTSSADPYSLHRLSNGMEVYFFESADLPFISVNLYLKTGEAWASPDKSGVASLTGHLLDKGTQSSQADEILERMESIAAPLKVSIEREGMTFDVSSLSEHWEKLLDNFFEVIMEPTFPEEEFKKEKNQAIGRIKQKFDNARALSGIASRHFFYGKKHPYGHTQSLSSLGSITRQDVVDFYELHYFPSNAVLSVVGKYDKQKVIDKLEALTANWKSKPGGELDLKISKPDPIKGFEVLVVNKEKQSQAQISFTGLVEGMESLSLEEIVAQNLVNIPFGLGGMSSILMDNIRVKKGLAYGIYSQFKRGKKYGRFVISTATANKNISQMLLSVFEVYDKFHKQDFNQGLIDYGYKQLRTSHFASRETLLSRANAAMDNILKGKEDWTEGFLPALEQAKDDKNYLNQTLKNKFDPKNLKIVISGSLKEFESQLKSLKPQIGDYQVIQAEDVFK